MLVVLIKQHYTKRIKELVRQANKTKRGRKTRLRVVAVRSCARFKFVIMQGNCCYGTGVSFFLTKGLSKVFSYLHSF